jgi:hypothetical protein
MECEASHNYEHNPLKVGMHTVISSFVHHGRFTVRIPDYRVQVLIANADPQEAEHVVSILVPTFKAPITEGSENRQLLPAARALHQRTPNKTGYSPATKKNKPRTPPDAHVALRNAPIPSSVHAMCLSSEQRNVLKACLEGRNVFFSGGAGTGKSLLLTHIVAALQDKVGRDAVFVTATTGLAACHIAATTVHQFAGLNTMVTEREEMAKMVMRRTDAVQRWTQARFDLWYYTKNIH